MATANTSGDGKENTLKEILCSEGLCTGTHGHLTFISVINIFLSITAFLGNALILTALRKESSLRPPSKLLLRSLATTDLFVGLISEPMLVAFLTSVVNEHWNICHYLFFARFETHAILGLVSLSTLTTISVDRLLALLLALRYREVVTLKRTYVVVITIWVVSTVFSTLHFWNVLITVWYGIIVMSLCLLTSIFSYTKIFLNLRRSQNQVQDQTQQPDQGNALNIARYRKAVSSVVWLQLTLVACYLPESVVVALMANIGLSSPIFVAYQYAATLAFLNSSLNPILYCWKIDEVRQAVKDTIRQVLCCLLI